MDFVASTLQGLGVTIAVNCLLVETVLLVLNLSTAAYEIYLNWKNGKPGKKIISSFWIKNEKIESMTNIFSDDMEAKNLVDPDGKLSRVSSIVNINKIAPKAENLKLGGGGVSKKKVKVKRFGTSKKIKTEKNEVWEKTTDNKMEEIKEN